MILVLVSQEKYWSFIILYELSKFHFLEFNIIWAATISQKKNPGKMFQ